MPRKAKDWSGALIDIYYDVEADIISLGPEQWRVERWEVKKGEVDVEGEFKILAERIDRRSAIEIAKSEARRLKRSGVSVAMRADTPAGSWPIQSAKDAILECPRYLEIFREARTRGQNLFPGWLTSIDKN